MKFNINVDFWFDGIDDESEDEIKSYLKELLEDGAEATASEIEILSIDKENES